MSGVELESRQNVEKRINESGGYEFNNIICDNIIRYFNNRVDLDYFAMSIEYHGHSVCKHLMDVLNKTLAPENYKVEYSVERHLIVNGCPSFIKEFMFITIYYNG